MVNHATYVGVGVQIAGLRKRAYASGFKRYSAVTRYTTAARYTAAAWQAASSGE